ncbi:hypothetical protein CF327_g5127 [Tilletia walkeri]|uniref:Serum paraoxonase/arylesterase n=2 Tax=Tilletia TaxID=13289 RepID=A0A8X7N8C4_9BASI|nr:hypothetical protein CF327_g5127 [Tilletia walkeri]KAE8267650.1 hypothetical protein A4X09_0g4685 [Tilletia walkeri]
MASNVLTPILGVVLLVLAVLYQTHFSTSIWAFAGLGRSLDLNLTSRAASQCQSYPELGACEDGWIHEDSGLLYLACSSIEGRRNWLPTMDRLNAAKRPTTDAVYVVDTRGSGSFASRITKIQPTSFDGINGDATLNLHGIAVLEVASKPTPAEGNDLVMDASYTPPTLYLYFNNHRPPMDPSTGKLLNAVKVGANSTVEIFKTTLGDKKMEHVRTYTSEHIHTPNRVAPISPDSFLWTNDHAVKVGLRRLMSYVSNDGSVGFCDPSGCKIVADKLGYPNGIVASAKPNQFWVPAMREGKMKLFEWQPKDQSLVLIDDIYLDGPPGYPADNLSLNKRTGAIIATSMSSIVNALFGYFYNFEKLTPSAVHRVTLNDGRDKFFGEKYKTEKLLEFDGVEFGGYTTAVEDLDRKKMWLFGVGTPMITVCDMP